MSVPRSRTGAVWTVLEPGWTMTDTGLVLFAAWNLLLFAMAVPGLASFRQRLVTTTAAARPQ